MASEERDRRRRSRSLRPPSESSASEASGQSYSSNGATLYGRSTSDKVVKLNVGGRKFDTTEATLGARGENFLTSLAVMAEADYYGISLPSQEGSSSKKIKYGLFVSTKYGENEIIVFSDICTGYIIRGGSSKVQFRYRTDGDGVLEVVWSSDIRNRQAQKERATLSNSRSSISSSRRNHASSETRGTHTPSTGSPSHSAPTNEPSPMGQSSDESLSLPFPANGGYTKSTIWFLQGNQLNTSASNVYNFVPNLREFPSAIFTNGKAGISIYDGTVSGFRLPKSNTPPPFLLNSHFSRRGTFSGSFTAEEIPESPPPTSPLGDHSDEDGTGSDDASLDAREAVFVDIRNQWVKCEFKMTSYCDSVVAYHVTCRPIESIRYKSSLPYPFGGTNEYEWCRESFNIELIVLEEHVIARLVSYNLIRKDRSVVTMQYNTTFHRFARQGEQVHSGLLPE